LTNARASPKRKRAYFRTAGSQGLEKITQLERSQCKYGTDCRVLATLERTSRDEVTKQCRQMDV
jgi:hypothetical protein